MWDAKQESAGDLTFERIIHSLFSSNYSSYKSGENKAILQRSYHEDDYAFAFRIRNVVHVLQSLQKLKFFPYPKVITNARGLIDIEKRLITAMGCEMQRKHGHDWVLNEKIDGMVMGDEPTDYEMMLDFEPTCFYEVPSVTGSQDVIDEHNRYITDAHNRYLDLWIDKNGRIEPRFLAECCHEQLSSIDSMNISSSLGRRLKEEELVEAFECRFNKILEKFITKS